MNVLCYTALVLAVGCYLTVLALYGRRLAGKAGAHEICSLELSLRCEVMWLHAGISLAAMAIYTQGFYLWVQQCRSAKGTRTSSSRALAEGRPRSEGKDTLHSITSQIQLFQEGKGFLWSLIASSLTGCSVLSASVFDCFGSPALCANC